MMYFACLICFVRDWLFSSVNECINYLTRRILESERPSKSFEVRSLALVGPSLVFFPFLQMFNYSFVLFSRARFPVRDTTPRAWDPRYILDGSLCIF